MDKYNYMDEYTYGYSVSLYAIGGHYRVYKIISKGAVFCRIMLVGRTKSLYSEIGPPIVTHIFLNQAKEVTPDEFFKEL